LETHGWRISKTQAPVQSLFLQQALARNAPVAGQIFCWQFVNRPRKLSANEIQIISSN
jgi:hypothetical protein